MPNRASLVASRFLAALASPFFRRMVVASSEVAVGLLESHLAVHHARAGLVAEFLHVCCADRRYVFCKEKRRRVTGRHRVSVRRLVRRRLGRSRARRGAQPGRGPRSSGPPSSIASRVASTSADSFIPRPAMTASAMREANRRMARSASSLPGITKSTSSGSQFVSTMPSTGIFSLRASSTRSFPCGCRPRTPRRAAGSSADAFEVF